LCTKLVEVSFQCLKELSAQAVSGAFGPTLWVAALSGLERLQISQLFLCTSSDGFAPRFGHFPLRVHLMFSAQNSEAQPCCSTIFPEGGEDEMAAFVDDPGGLLPALPQ
jgi:hypothetical protein